MKEMIKDLNTALESGANVNEKAKDKNKRLKDRFQKGAKSEALKRKKK